MPDVQAATRTAPTANAGDRALVTLTVLEHDRELAGDALFRADVRDVTLAQQNLRDVQLQLRERKLGALEPSELRIADAREHV